jgi:hypothetical protein
MTRIILTSLLVLGVAGCSVAERIGIAPTPSARPAAAAPAPAETVVPGAAPVSESTLTPATTAPPPPAAARTAEALDTTTAEQRAAAAAPAAAAGASLGSTVAALGSPTEPGLWLKTPLVSSERQGRVTNPANGKSATVTLIPLAGPATGGSQMSLAAMRLIEASLTDLTTVDVTAG